MSLAKIIFDDRAKRKLSMSDYAKLLNNHTDGSFCAQNINAIEKGRRYVPIKAIPGVSKITGTPVDVLLWHKGVLPNDICAADFSTDEIEAILEYARFLIAARNEKSD